MLEQIASVLPVFNQAMLSALLLVGVLIAWQIFRVFRDFATVMKRIEMITDIAGWVNLWKRFNKKR